MPKKNSRRHIEANTSKQCHVLKSRAACDQTPGDRGNGRLMAGNPDRYLEFLLMGPPSNCDSFLRASCSFSSSFMSFHDPYLQPPAPPPPPPADDPNNPQKKRKRGATRLSCAECRRCVSFLALPIISNIDDDGISSLCHRLKLRCDRAVPCGSCLKRGCAAICPDGMLFFHAMRA